ncbi:MAG: thioredoxin family protein [Holosporaceae bacterium]|jgi:suppressor for copper-sensitivity B|nr:thioredoxin family protein [Holosporaceae bacterium]
MKKIVQKVVLILLSALFFMDSACGPFVNVGIVADCRRISAETFRCELILSVSKGWKLPKAPDITVLKSENLKNFKYDGNYERLNETTYKTSFTIEAEKGEIGENKLELSIDCPVCGDICTIVSKNVRLIVGDERTPFQSLWKLILFALLGLLGGLTLNVMPCVLPVILMKLKSMKSREAIWGSIAGNYASFSIFSAFIISLKIAGETAGWGMHFQNPYFLEAITFILFGLTLYSFGIITWFPAVRMGGEKRRAFWGNFLSSIVASIVAIPCTAPFLGTAATFAIQGSIPNLCLIFFAIATGFSLPYFLSFFLPIEIFNRFRDCGDVFKKVVNCGALITFLWIFWLLSNYFSPVATALYALSFAGMAFLLWRRRYLWAAILLGICFVGWQYRDFVVKTEDSYEDAIARLTAESAKNQAIIFNITADWCLTCKYNHYRVFGDKKVMEFMKNNRVKFIEADMTKRNDVLMKFINDHNRVGIPFTIIYGPKAPHGILLNEILTVDAVAEAIKKVK